MSKIDQDYRNMLMTQLQETGRASLHKRIDGLSRAGARALLTGLAYELGFAPGELKFLDAGSGVTTLVIKSWIPGP